MDFSKLFPGAAAWVEGLHQTWPFLYLQDIYAPFGALHLVGMALLGGCILLVNLRLLGAGLTTKSASHVEKSVRSWQLTGAAIVLLTGVIIGALNSAKLYYSPAFLAKMIAMAAALIFTFGVCNSVARREGQVSAPAKTLAVIAVGLWLGSLWVFGSTDGLNPGVFHVVTAGFALLMIFGHATRFIAMLGFGVLILGVSAMYFIVGMDNGDQLYLDISSWGLIAAAILLSALLVFEVFRGDSDVAHPAARAIAIFSVLSWVTVAAAGRWIGFS